MSISIPLQNLNAQEKKSIIFSRLSIDKKILSQARCSLLEKKTGQEKTFKKRYSLSNTEDFDVPKKETNFFYFLKVFDIYSEKRSKK